MVGRTTRAHHPSLSVVARKEREKRKSAFPR